MNVMTQPMKLYKATVTVSSEVEEVPVWAASLDDALAVAEEHYGEVTRIRMDPNKETPH